MFNVCALFQFMFCGPLQLVNANEASLTDKMFEKLNRFDCKQTDERLNNHFGFSRVSVCVCLINESK